jgi:hypothetical protein
VALPLPFLAALAPTTSVKLHGGSARLLLLCILVEQQALLLKAVPVWGKERQRVVLESRRHETAGAGGV